MNGSRSHGGNNRQNAIKIVDLVQSNHDLYDSVDYSNALFKVLGFDDVFLQPSCKLNKSKTFKTKLS